MACDWHWERLDEICQGISDCPIPLRTIVDRGPYIARSLEDPVQCLPIEDAGRISGPRTKRESLVRNPDMVICCTAGKAPTLGLQPSSLTNPGLSWTTHGAFETKSRKGQSSIPPILAQLTDFGIHIHGYRDGTVCGPS